VLSHKFDIEAPDGAKYVVEGNLLAHDFTIKKDDAVVATVSKKYFAIADTYGVDVVDGEDQGQILCLCITIDQALHD